MQHIQWVTGKGGVGKSLVAALLARKFASEGKRTLLVDMVPESYLSRSLGFSQPFQGTTAQKTPYGFDLALWLGEACLAEYVQYWVKVPRVSGIFLSNQWLKSLIYLAPGLREIAFLGKLTSQTRRHGPPLNYDVIVVDAVSTGHFLALLKTPLSLSQTVTSGPMYEQSRQIHQVLQDPKLTRTLLVTNLERYSLHESQELRTQLQEKLQQDCQLVANKVFSVPKDLEPLSTAMPEELQKFLKAQYDVKNYQDQALQELKKETGTVYQIPFFYTDWSKTLENRDEISRLFTEV